MYNRPIIYASYGKPLLRAGAVALGFCAAIIGMTAIAAVCVYVFGKVVGII